MAESRYIKNIKRYRDQGLNQHHRNGASSVVSQPTKHIDTPKNRKPERNAQVSQKPAQAQRPKQRVKSGSSITARLAVQLGVLSIAAAFYVNFFFELFAVFAAVPAIGFLSVWGKLLHKTSPHRSAPSLAFESGLLLLIFVWIVRLCAVMPAYTYPLILLDPVELGFRMGDLVAAASPLMLMAWILEVFLLTMVAPVRMYRARKRQSQYDPMR